MAHYIVCCITLKCYYVLGESEDIILYNQALWNMLSHSNSMTLHWQHALYILATALATLSVHTKQSIAVC